MNGKYFFTSATAILAIALVGYAETTRTMGVVSVGPLVPTVSTPRVRVANDRPAPVDVWYVPVGADSGRRLGSVDAQATETFAVPGNVQGMRLLVRPQDARSSQYVTSDIVIGQETDVSLRVALELDRSTVEVTELDVVGPREDAEGTNWPFVLSRWHT